MYQSFYTGALGAGTCMAKMSILSNNLANINNNGFKPKTAAFTDLLQFNLNDSENATTELQAGVCREPIRILTLPLFGIRTVT